jgi:lipoate synthase
VSYKCKICGAEVEAPRVICKDCYKELPACPLLRGELCDYKCVFFFVDHKRPRCHLADLVTMLEAWLYVRVT